MYGGTFLPFSSRMLFSIPVSLNKKRAAFSIVAAQASARPAGTGRGSADLRKKAGPATSAAGGFVAKASGGARRPTRTTNLVLKLITQRHLNLAIWRNGAEDRSDRAGIDRG